MQKLKIPKAPMSIKKGFPLKLVLDEEAVNQLAENVRFVYGKFNSKAFTTDALQGISPLSITERSQHIADALHQHLPSIYSTAITILLKSLTPPLDQTEKNGLSVMFYMPHCNFVATYGIDPSFNNGEDPFNISMRAQYEITQRFTCEYSIRPFIVSDESRTMKLLYEWMTDSNPHIRRLCSEGTRPRLPWSRKIDSFVNDPSPSLPILELLKDDPDLYVRRSVANHVGDIAKDHMDLALDLCEKWLVGASPNIKWVIRHALRNPHKKGVERAIELRKASK